ncbi:MAG: hypothetical protein EBX41_07085 [Chitinophagia bacterium]|nr:hypothetical protein [Chitinophagia bacterium]
MQSQFNTTAAQVIYGSELVKRPSEIKKRIVDSNLVNNINLTPQNEVIEDYINTYIKRIEMRFMS